MDFLGMLNPPKNRRKTILAVDDQPDILDTLKRLLEYDYDVYCMTTAEIALKFLNIKVPDLILLDIEMPEMNGIELLRVIKGIKKLKKVPVVFVTSHAAMSNLQSVAHGGGDGFIEKPVDLKFVQRIKKYLGDE